jgi:hypothetical protein
MNPIENAFAWYQFVVDKAIEDRPQEDGTVIQACNMPMLAEFVKAEPKSAQLIVQLLHQGIPDAAGAAGEAAALHGTWICAAYMIAFGKFGNASLMLRDFAPKYYAAALELLETLPAEDEPAEEP